jgi:hypothetical protein
MMVLTRFGRHHRDDRMHARVRFAMRVLLALLPVAAGCSTSPQSTGGPSPDASQGSWSDGSSDGQDTPDALGTEATAGDAAGTEANAGATGTDGGPMSCAAPVASAPSVKLADFESGAIPSSDTMAEGFRGADVTSGTIVHPGANGTTAAAQFDFKANGAIFFQGMTRQQYLDGSSTYHPDLANAVEFYLRVPMGSMLLSAGAGTFGFWTYHWLHGDPWVGTNATGGNLTDSQMHGYSNLRFDPASAGTWQHVVLSTSAFAQSRGNYHFYAARAVVQDQTFFGSLRQFEMVTLRALMVGPTAVDLDELRLVTLPPTAWVCPPFVAQTVSAASGDVAVPVTIFNPTAQMRSYRVFVSSEIGVDRQTLEIAMHDTDNVVAVDDLQAGVGADGGLGAAELFAADAAGQPSGASIVTSGREIVVPVAGNFKGVLVHHVKPAMLGALQPVTSGGHTYMVRRNTLTTSVIVWDPSAPRASDASVVFTGSNADSGHAVPPGFPSYVAPPAGWASTDVAIDQAGGYFVSSLTLTP